MINVPLHIAVLPLNIVPAGRAANLRAVEEALGSLRRDTDIVCLPELFTTGFISDPELCAREAETDDGMTITTLKALAGCRRVAIAGSFLGRNADATEYYNRGFIIEPTGEVSFVNKRHLFHVSPEAQVLTGGDTPYAVVRYRGWNIALGICYDLRFPVWCRNTMTRGRHAYDVFLLPANWPQSRAVALEALAKARAIENQAYVVVANRSGVDEYGEYDGLSFVEDYIGTRMITAAAGEVVYATADREGLEKLRAYMPAGLDSDDFKIIY